MQKPRWQQVSFAEEPLILVNGEDEPCGFDSKLNVHAGAGKLHRAFSIFLFRDPEHVLLHQRSSEKPLWPGFWTNSCCSHPRRGECNRIATSRRLEQELGVSTDLQFLYRFQYQASFEDLGSEHELCSVYIGKLEDDRDLRVNRSEISKWGWFHVDTVDKWLETEPESLTPWFKLEWQQLRVRYAKDIESLFSGSTDTDLRPHAMV
ncbi:MAG: isopentenyl-diphosphate Delta-isomerase [Chromatocurvus sp.]